MFRPTLTALTALFFLAPTHGAEEVPAPPAPKPSATSTVFYAQNADAVYQFQENAAITRRMVDQLVIAVTGQPTVTAAWRTLVSPKDRVGIKVATAGAPYCVAHLGVVEAIVEGIASAGVPRKQIIVWDRDTDTLRSAGFAPNSRYSVRAIDPPRGYDRSATFTAPVLGKLIWGDLLFREKVSRVDGRRPSEADQLSSTSHFASILSRDVTKIINVPVLTEEAGCGIAGALYNLTVPNVDNWRRFLQLDASTTESIASLYADDHIASKVVLTLMDALIAQYAGGPGFQPNYAFEHQTLYASRDPVAVDAIGLRKLEEWRKPAKLAPIGKRAEWLETAGQLGIGNSAQERIILLPAGR